MPLELWMEDQAPMTKDVFTLDPAVRTFMTGESPLCEAFQVGDEDVDRIYRLAYALDRFQSKWSQKV
ncbi:hypothetical protein GAYE_SCF48G5978 [Galdieria yellowstonensis]|uniref:Uncharacterized protein n=1 Tax=Galdieria yellowstonensis TaxID=3028027 RepID=A0AAV9ILA5_9RHOD|nr:hypothetical protein GAYE_SCF48G5978 [Galdieria yellowstonensis]